ncbi:uncharacterized protein PFL1_04613 [Pseudozyma flocculosa PF-1]|uniref:JmjC domain-containing protein n=1 Tax=Pseudozyma flocculosa PF-1 TaxID=1277687 RepID=A0A061H5X5_9BASI|nr:uncharacterized protein PFL1_04613 [Pseudozyma flocculosa PF-1]EPQ27869.1 hypothetical protein PFL1_04613 [Pseudozyma flocculosa PF-1]
MDHLELISRCLVAVGEAAASPSSTLFDPATADLQGCSPPALGLLRSALRSLLRAIDGGGGGKHASLPATGNDSPRSCHEYSSLARNLAAVGRLCDEAFLSFHYADIPTCWRRLYTDAILLKACAALALLEPSHAAAHPHWTSLVRDLDLAIIVAGAPGPGRAEAIHDLIRAAQTAIASPLSPALLPAAEHTRPAKRSRLETVEYHAAIDGGSGAPLQPTSLADGTIDSFDSPPSLATFLDRSGSDDDRGSCRRPFIVRGFAKDWPASQPLPSAAPSSSPPASGAPRWASADYLERIAGPGRVVPVEVGAKYTDDDWGQDIILWSDFLRLSGWAQAAADPTAAAAAEDKPLYLAQHDLLSQFPDLRRDMILPDYVYSSPPVPPGVPGYRPPGNDEALILNAWLGPAATVSPPHFDMFYNCFVQVVGYKEIWLAPPDVDVDGAMAPFGRGRGRGGEDGEDDGGAACPDSSDKDGLATSLMTNTSRIDVFASSSSSSSSPSCSDQVATSFREDVQPRAQRAVLGPGDMLFMPPKWWHSFRSRTKSFSVSMWF